MRRIGLAGRRTGVLVALAAGALLVPLISGAGAATPTSGTVSDTAPSTTWSAGPFAVPNPTGAAGTPDCSAAPCDDYALHVSTPAGYDTGHQLAISISWANTAAD